MSDYASARADIERHVEDASSAWRAVCDLGLALLRVSTEACGLARTEELFAHLAGEARVQHARRRGGRSA